MKWGAGTVTLSGDNTYTGTMPGGTWIEDGTLQLSGSSALPSGATVTTTNGGTLNLGGVSFP